jgi:phosphonate transport system substrate-binding protein
MSLRMSLRMSFCMSRLMSFTHRLAALGLIAGFCVATSPVRAQDPERAPAAGTLTLGISEGTSGGLDHARVLAKYGALADALGAAIKRKVQVVFAREFSALENGMRTARFDLVMARPSDYPARGLRDYGYQFVASARPDGQCLIITSAKSKVQSLADTQGLRWVLPEQVSYMSKFCARELQSQGITIAPDKLKYVREQGAVPFFLDNNFADVGGIASYSGVARKLDKAKHRVIHRSVAQPYFPLIAGQRVSAEQIRALQATLTALPQSAAGRDILKTIGIEAFDVDSGERLQKLLPWLGL